MTHQGPEAIFSLLIGDQYCHPFPEEPRINSQTVKRFKYLLSKVDSDRTGPRQKPSNSPKGEGARVVKNNRTLAFRAPQRSEMPPVLPFLRHTCYPGQGLSGPRSRP